MSGDAARKKFDAESYIEQMSRLAGRTSSRVSPKEGRTRGTQPQQEKLFG
jgi:hypothetical protein